MKCKILSCNMAVLEVPNAVHFSAALCSLHRCQGKWTAGICSVVFACMIFNTSLSQTLNLQGKLK